MSIQEAGQSSGDEPELKKGPTLSTILARSVRLRCPRCGVGKMFRGIFRMNADCPGCGFRFSRESGFYLGSIYVNYGLTAVIATVTYLVLVFYKEYPETYVQIGTLAFALSFPVWFFRYARSIWLGIDQFLDPR